MVVPSRIVEGVQLTAKLVKYYTGPPSTKAVIKKLIFCNTTGQAVGVSVFLVPASQPADQDPVAANQIWYQQPIQAGQQRECFEAEGQVLEPGDMLFASGQDISMIATAALIANTGS